MNKFKYIVWVGGVDDYYINYLNAKRDYDNWINQGYNDVCIEFIGKVAIINNDEWGQE